MAQFGNNPLHGVILKDLSPEGSRADHPIAQEWLYAARSVPLLASLSQLLNLAVQIKWAEKAGPSTALASLRSGRDDNVN